MVGFDSEKNGSTRMKKEEIYQQYSAMVSSLANRMISNKETARDAAQQVWMEVLKSLDSFQKQSKLSTWIYTIAYRTIIRSSQEERQYTVEFLEEYFSGDSLENETDVEHEFWVRTQCDNCLTGILHCLDNESRMIYILRDIAGLEYNEIANITEQKESAVRLTISRTRRKLKSFLTRQCSLFNPNSPKKCKMAKHVVDINLRKEYQKIREVISISKFYLLSEKVLPDKDYWIGLLK